MTWTQQTISRRLALRLFAAVGASFLEDDLRGLSRFLKLVRPWTSDALIQERIAPFAPIVQLHPTEQYFPMNPRDFIRRSRFRHHKGGPWPFGKDEGYNKRTKDWVKTNSHESDYYNIPVSTINKFGLHADMRNRRPYDKESGHDCDVFLQTRRKERGVKRPTNVVPVFFHVHGNPRSSRYRVQYFAFYGYNKSLYLPEVRTDDSPLPMRSPAPISFSHQGDWENVIVEIHNERVRSVCLSAHGGSSQYRRDQLEFQDEHPIVFAAKGSHAFYRRPGRYRHDTDVADWGYAWETHQNLKLLRVQPWRDFAGAWGEVGSPIPFLGRSVTTGPLGPWYKRIGRPASEKPKGHHEPGGGPHNR
jgi:hypothetical protein